MSYFDILVPYMTHETVPDPGTMAGTTLKFTSDVFVPEGSFRVTSLSDAKTDEQILQAQEIVDALQKDVNTALEETAIMWALKSLAGTPGLTKEHLQLHIDASIHWAEKHHKIFQANALKTTRNIIVNYAWQHTSRT